MTEHMVGKCDICHGDLKGFGVRGIIHEINQIIRFCDECWEKEEKL